MAIRSMNKPTFHLVFRSSVCTTASLFCGSKPQFFSQNPERNLIPFSNLFERYGFTRSQVHGLLEKNQLLLNSSPSEIEKSLKVLLSLRPSKDFLVSIVSSCPSVLELEFIEKWKIGFSEMGISNVTKMAMKNVLEVSRKFDVDPCDVSTSMKCLKSLGFSNSTVLRVLEAVPMVIMLDEDKIRAEVEVLLRIGFQAKDVDRVLSLFPEYLAFGVEDRLKTLLDEFADLGFSLSEVKREVLRDPKVLGLENGELSHCLKILSSLKCRVPIKESIFRNGAFRAAYEVKLRVDCLRKYGLILRDAFTVLWKEPRVILYKREDIEKKIEFLVDEMKLDVECLVEVPKYLGVNFEKHIVPRYSVIEHLRSKGGLGDEVMLKDLITLSRLRFYNLYVKPYPECEKIYRRFAGDVEFRSPYPTGMWKLFQPQKYPQSSEDIKNIKSYMESFA